jgi:SAM-dependent methyltransferase
VHGVVAPVEGTQQTYAVIAPEYARRTGTVDDRLLDEVQRFTDGLLAGATIADVGCGPGRDVELLRGRGFHVVGFDMSRAQLEVGRLLGVVQADMRRLPLKTASVDAIWCRAALLHLPRSDAEGTVLGFAEAIRGGGRLYLAVAEGDGEGWEVADNYDSDRKRWFTYYREPALRALLHKSGFQVNHIARSRAYRDWLSIFAERVREPTIA